MNGGRLRLLSGDGWGRLRSNAGPLAESQQVEQARSTILIALLARRLRRVLLLLPLSTRGRHIRAQDVRAMMRRGVRRQRAVGRRGNGGMVIAVQLGMGIALAIVGRVLGVRWEHALRVGLLVGLLGLLIVRISLTRDIRRRGPRANAGQQGLEIVGGGHFCLTPQNDRRPLNELKLCELSIASFPRVTEPKQ